MVPLHALWLPIVVSSVIVFFLSWLIHMLVPYHRADFKALPSEDKVMDALRPFNIVVGRLQQFEDDVFHILADIARFGQGRGVRHREWHVDDSRQCLGQQRLANAGGADQ